MKQIIFATTSKGKFNGAVRVFQHYNIEAIQVPMELPESQNTLEIIATNKAKYAFNIIQKPVIAMDAGFFIHDLKGFPMMYVKPVLESIGIEGILKIAEGKKRDCEFREVIAYYDGKIEEPKLFTRIVKGMLSTEPSGTMSDKHWSELALIFIPEHHTKTMAEMDDEEFATFAKQVDDNSHFEQFARFYTQDNVWSS